MDYNEIKPITGLNYLREDDKNDAYRTLAVNDPMYDGEDAELDEEFCRMWCDMFLPPLDL